MLSDEEKEALEILKGFEPDDLVECAIYLQALEKITNLIKKQSKEIEELKEDNKKKSIVIIEYQDLYEKLEDKIKAKIEEIDLAIFKNQTIYTVNKMQEIKFARLCLAELLEKE